MHRDSFLDFPARKKSREQQFNAIVYSGIGSGYNTERPVTVDTAIRIDLLPAGVHYCYPIRSDLPGRAHLVRMRPTKAIRHDVALPRLIREVPIGLNPKRKGVMGHRPSPSGSLCTG